MSSDGTRAIHKESVSAGRDDRNRERRPRRTAKRACAERRTPTGRFLPSAPQGGTMGLRCLLGHDFGEPELQREREEDGDEVVTTVKEVKTCARCGETQIVSENTEVTTMEQLADEAAADAAATPEGGSGPAPTEGSTPGAAPGTVDADDAASGTGGLTLDEEPGAGS